MKLLLSFLLLFNFLVIHNIFCQESMNELMTQIESVKSLCSELRIENESLRDNINRRDSIEYSILRHQIFEAFSQSAKLNTDYLITTDKMAVTGLFTRLLQANNPTSDILGFRFHETIMKAAEKHFTSEVKSATEKSRLHQIISKLVNNPVVASVINTNPITSVTASIINTVAGFSTTEIAIEKEGNKVRNVSALTMDAFSQQSIEAFRTELQPYIQFYDALNLSAGRYLTGLESMNQRYLYLKSSVDAYRVQLFGSVRINDTNTFLKLSGILPDPATGKLNYSKYLNDPGVIKCSVLANKISSIEQSVTDFQGEHERMLNTFLREYVTALQSAKSLPSASLDHSKIDLLIHEIEMYQLLSKSH